MPKFRIYYTTEASYSVAIEAEDEEAAVDAGYELAPTLCAHCSGWGGQVGIDLGDWESDEVVEEK